MVLNVLLFGQGRTAFEGTERDPPGKVRPKR